MAKDITLKTRNGETRYPKTVTALVYENGTGKTLQTIIDEMRQVDSDTNTRTQHFKADVNNLDTLKNKTDIGLYNYVGTGWRGSVSVCYDSADNVSQVALSSSTPSYNGNTLTWLSAQPCAMARTYTNGAWSHWEKVGAPVVNDFTGGTDKALSAEMGKTLKEGLDALGPKIDEAKETLQDEINGRSRFLETEEGVFVIDKQKYIGAKLVDGVFDALGFGSNLTSIIVSLFNSLIEEQETELQLVKATENEGINIVDGDGNIVFSLRFSVVEEEGLFLVDNELNIGVQWHDGKWSACNTRVPMVDLVPDHTLKDFSTEISNFSFNESDILEQVYAQMDTLVDTYDFVSKVDAADLMGIEYPFYANGVSAQTTYTDAEGVVSTIEPTPAYKIYMYKFEYHKAACGYGTTVPRKKILIVGGVHGNEIAAPANLYLLAKGLCEGTDINLFKLFSVFDFYIVPCVNGYGMYHLTRGNARSVNLNRNFPIEKWYLTGKSNITATTNGYTGPTPGSEFETQLIVALTDYIKPDVAIDHHNYSRQDMQFYTEVPEKTLIPVAYKSLADCSCAFVKGLPSYFGASYNLFKNTTAVTIAAPLGIQRETEGKTSRWWYENGVDVAATVEVCASINYRNGVYSTNPNYNADAFSVGEYTLRNLLTHYCNYYIKKYINF